MRPRSGKRGNATTARRPVSRFSCFNGAAFRGTRKLRGSLLSGQVDLRFNGAAFRGTRKCSSPTLAFISTSPLQWGRVPGNAEIRLVALVPRDLHALQWGRVPGNAEIRPRATRQGVAVDASMGPRSGERGNHQLTPDAQGAFLLQWGRVPGNAETAGIQFIELRVFGFNGAAFRGTRK